MYSSEDHTLLQQIQAEVDLIKSMYGGEVEDLRNKNVTKEERLYCTTAVRLHMTPLSSFSEDLVDHHTMVTIKLETDNNYPTSPASMTIENYKGLTPSEMSELELLLKKELAKAAKDKAVVFYEICRTAKEYLSEHERPDRGSVYEEMVANHEAEEQKHKKRQKEELKRKQEEKELRSRQIEKTNEIYVCEKKAERQKAMMSSTHNIARSLSLARDSSQHAIPTTSNKTRNRSSHSYSDGNSSNAANCYTLTGLNKQERVVELLHGLVVRDDHPHSTYKVIDRTTGSEGVLHYWHANLKPIPRLQDGHPVTVEQIQLDDITSKINGIERELKSLMKLSSEQVVVYEAYAIQQTATRFDVYLLQPYISACSLSHYLQRKVTFSEGTLRYFAKGILLSLLHLHDSNVVHRDLKESNVFLNSSGSDVLRIADYSVERRLLEAIMDYYNLEAPQVYFTPSGTGGQKRDIYRLGLILLSLFNGKRISDGLRPEIPSSFSPNFRDFLCRCFDQQENSKCSAKQLLTHAFIEEIHTAHHYLPSSSSITKPGKPRRNSFACDVNGDNQENSTANDTTNDQLDSSSVSDIVVPEDSRLHQDFELLAMIGRGGFGRVYKVRNIIDKSIYAVKQIKLENDPSSDRILKEAQTLSTINHEHIVRYYTSWIEYIQPCSNDDCDLDMDESFSDINPPTRNSKQRTIFSMNSNGSVGNIEFTSDYLKQDNDDESEYIVFGSNSAEEVSTDESDHNKKSEKKHTPASLMSSPSKGSVKGDLVRHLLIKMEFCENKTLRQAIDDGLYMENSRMWRLFREMVQGLDFIHSLQLIHRDLKPGNVFLDSRDHVKIGDFGLATVVRDNHADKNVGSSEQQTKSNIEDSSTVAAGTYFYRAPEVNLGKSESIYTTKLDMYSLGVIFFEMTSVLPNSSHERCEILCKIRRPDIDLPSEFEENRFTNKRKLVKWLLDHKPEKRPSTSELLRSDLLPPLSAEEQKFKEKLESKLENKNSEASRYALNLFLKSSELDIKELQFMHMIKGSKIQPQHLDYVANQMEKIFRSYGGIWIPSYPYVPKDCFYDDTNKDNYHFITETGTPLTACSDLRYPFSRLAAINKYQSVRRYSIDRVLRFNKMNPDFPSTCFECAFDLISSSIEKYESCARILRLGQDVTRTLLDPNKDLINCVNVDISFLPLAKLLLKACGIPETNHAQALAFIKQEVKNGTNARAIQDALLQELNLDSTNNILWKYINWQGSINEFSNILVKKNVPPSVLSEIDKKVSEVKIIVANAMALNVDHTLNFRPLIVPDYKLYSEFSFQFVLNSAKIKTKRSPIFAQGGSFDDLIKRHKDVLPRSQVGHDPFSATGISFSLEFLTAIVFQNSDDPVPLIQTFQGLSCSGSMSSVFVLYIGEGYSPLQTKLRVRAEIVSALHNNNISADFAYVSNEDELSSFSSPVLVLFNSNSEKVTIKFCRNDRGYWSSEKRVSEGAVLETVLSIMNTSEQDSRSNLSNSSFPSEDSVSFEVFSRKSKQRESMKSDEQSRREKDVAGLCSRWSVCSKSHQIILYSLDLDRESLLLLGTLDLDSNSKNFNESLSLLKQRISSRDSDYVEKFARTILQKINSRRQLDRPLCIGVYNAQSDYYKRIF